jgi:hypothetical protein
MPVENRELVIRAVVNSDQQEQKTSADRRQVDEQAIEAIVEECVRQVLKILKKSGER